MSGVGRIADESHRVRELVETTGAEARSVRGEFGSKVDTLAVKADASTAHIVEEMMGRVWEVVAYSEAQASCIAETITQQLEREI